MDKKIIEVRKLFPYMDGKEIRKIADFANKSAAHAWLSAEEFHESAANTIEAADGPMEFAAIHRHSQFLFHKQAELARTGNPDRFDAMGFPKKYSENEHDDDCQVHKPIHDDGPCNCAALRAAGEKPR